MGSKRLNSHGYPTLSDYVTVPTDAVSQRGGRKSPCIPAFPDKVSPLVSVVTIVRNSADLLAKTIEAVNKQTYQNVEYIIVDGGSTDGTVNVLRKYDEQISLWISEPDKGISDAFNKGIALARGQLIGLCNAGDWYDPAAIAKVVDCFQQTGADIIYGDLQVWERDVKSHVITPHDNLQRTMRLNHPTVFVTRSSYEKIGLFRCDFKLAMDYEWLYRARVAGLKFSPVDAILSNMPGGGTSSQNWLKTRREGLRVKQLYSPGIKNYIYFAWQMFLAFGRRFLEVLGLQALVRHLQSKWGV